MMHLTKEEKANRYDALQTAIKYTIDQYERLAKECEPKGEGPVDAITAFKAGMGYAYKSCIDDMERWI